MTLGAALTQEGRSWTAEAFMALSKEGHRYEVVDGKPIDRGSAGALHGYVCSLLLSALTSYVLSKKLGVVLDYSTAFNMKSGNWRSPDNYFFYKERMQGITEKPTRIFEGAPQKAVEFLKYRKKKKKKK
jgi:Uma2 family endonuclease